MSEDSIHYTFKIDGFQPDDMPFHRLVEYYALLQKMLDIGEGVHLVGIVEGSHANQFNVEPRFQTAIEKRVMAINAGTAPKPVLGAQEKINAMLADDKTSGSFSSNSGDNVIRFPGSRKEDPEPVVLRDSASFSGELYQIGSVGSDIKIRISTDEFSNIICTTTKDIAKRMRSFVFEHVRVSGRGLWSKGAKGNWEISDFHVTDFTPLEKQTLRQAVDSIRGLDIDWPDDSIGAVAQFSDKGSVQ